MRQGGAPSERPGADLSLHAHARRTPQVLAGGTSVRRLWIPTDLRHEAPRLPHCVLAKL